MGGAFLENPRLRTNLIIGYRLQLVSVGEPAQFGINAGFAATSLRIARAPRMGFGHPACPLEDQGLSGVEGRQKR